MFLIKLQLKSSAIFVYIFVSVIKVVLLIWSTITLISDKFISSNYSISNSVFIWSWFKMIIKIHWLILMIFYVLSFAIRVLLSFKLIFKKIYGLSRLFKVHLKIEIYFFWWYLGIILFLKYLKSRCSLIGGLIEVGLRMLGLSIKDEPVVESISMNEYISGRFLHELFDSFVFYYWHVKY